jgi:hypothetical protein
MHSNMSRLKTKEDKVLYEIKVLRLKQEIASDLIQKFPFVERKLTLTKVKLMPLKNMFKLQSQLELNYL